MKKNRNGWLESKTHRQCTNCRCIFEKTGTKTMSICALCNTARVKSQSTEYKMCARAKMRAKERDLPFNIEVDDIVIPQECPVLGIPIYVTTGKSGGWNNSPSLDQIIPSKGYTKGNIMVMSQLANAMKANAGPKELLAFSKWIEQTYSGEELNEPSQT